MAKCIPLPVVRRAVTALLAYATATVILTLLCLYLDACSEKLILFLGSTILTSLMGVAAVLYTGVAETPWSMLAVIYPLAGIAVYKTASSAMSVGDECRAVSLLSPLFTLLIPFTPLLCLKPRSEAKPRPWLVPPGAAPGASDAAVSHGGG